MYYYIFEPTKNKKEANQQEDVKTILQKNQVAGEFVTLSLAEKPQELAKIGLKRGYSTIVAVGGDGLINQVAGGLVGTDYVLGVIPTDPDSDFLSLTNVKDYEEACLALPQRRVATIDTAVINKERHLISKGEITPKSGQLELMQINFNNHFKTETRLKNLTVSNIGLEDSPEKIKNSLQDGLVDIYLPAKSEVKGGFWSIFSRLKQEPQKEGSIFHPKRVTIKTRNKLKLTMAEKEIEANPFKIKAVPESLNVIIKRESAKKVENQGKK